MIEHGTIIQSCKLKASKAKCPFIPLIDPQPKSWSTLSGISIDTQSAVTWHLNNISIAPDQHSINSWSIVGWLLTDWYALISLIHNGMHVCENELTLYRLSTTMLFKYQASVNQFPLSVNQGYQSTLNCGCL